MRSTSGPKPNRRPEIAPLTARKPNCQTIETRWIFKNDGRRIVDSHRSSVGFGGSPLNPFRERIVPCGAVAAIIIPAYGSLPSNEPAINANFGSTTANYPCQLRSTVRQYFTKRAVYVNFFKVIFKLDIFNQSTL